MKPTIAALVLLAGCREELPSPPDCDETPVAYTCEGDAFGRHVAYRRWDCGWASAAVDGGEPVVVEGYRVDVEGLTMSLAIGPVRLLVAEIEKPEVVQTIKCEEGP